MTETIAAVATPFGEGAISIIRISGPEAKEVLEKVFEPSHPEIFPYPRMMHYGHVKNPDSGKIIDEAMAVFFPAPHTYTGEDAAEIDCHGSLVAVRRVLDACLRAGARQAERGEFTKRAFLNGRIDLSQAEAVIDAVQAKTDRGYDAALRQLSGQMSEKIREIRQGLLDLLVELTVNIDYPDEDIEILTYEKLEKGARGALESVAGLLKTADTGKVLKEGLKTSIIGKPNVGKSSLLNLLLKEDRAIVTAVPGTTRDIIEEMISIRGIPVILTDTAGIRETDDIVEKVGIERSKKSLREADLILFVLDASSPLSEEDREILRETDPSKTIVIFGKSDLPAVMKEKEIKDILPAADILPMSMVTGKGLEKLKDKIEDLVYQGKVRSTDEDLVTNLRQEELLRDAEQTLYDALTMIQRRDPMEIVEIDIMSAYQSLGEILGEAVQGDVIDEVFSRFCLGK